MAVLRNDAKFDSMPFPLHIDLFWYTYTKLLCPVSLYDGNGVETRKSRLAENCRLTKNVFNSAFVMGGGHFDYTEHFIYWASNLLLVFLFLYLYNKGT